MRRVLIAVFVLGLAIVMTRAHASPHEPCTSPRIHIVKHAARLQLVCDEGTRTYPVTFGASPVGQKAQQGDERTPEGAYTIVAHDKRERFHRFLRLSYPNAADRERARKAGVDPGGGIGIHGSRTILAGVARAFIRYAPSLAWGPTDGCIALTNEDIEAVFDAVPNGTPVLIDP